MFPTCVGMNRFSPHVTTLPFGVFPTCVGMNRKWFQNKEEALSVPHVCGDEPALKEIPDLEDECSPRVWG